jgi:hypothetical protein
MAAFFNKTCPYKITDRKIIKLEQQPLLEANRRAKKQVFSETFVVIA